MWRRGRASHPCLIFVISVALGGCQQDDPHVTRPSKASTLDPAETSTSTTPRPDVETLPHEIPSSTESAAPIRPEPLIRIAPEVTKIVAPLDEEGYPDYLGAYEAAHSGIEPSKNIIAGLRELLGQQGLPEEAVEEYGRKLGVTLAKPGDAFFQTINLRPAFIAVIGDRELTAEEQAQLAGTSLQQQLDQAKTRPWSREEFPEVHSWIAANEGILPRIHAACRRPDIYMPIMAGASLVDVVFDQQVIVQFTNYLSTYAMLKTHEENTDRAIEALVSLGLLGSRLMEMPEPVTCLQGVSARVISGTLMILVVKQSEVGSERLELMESELIGFAPPEIDLSRFIEWDRMRFLDAMCVIAKDIHDKPAARKFNFDRALVVANEYFDRLAEQPTQEVLKEILEEINAEQLELRREFLAAVPDPTTLIPKDGSGEPSPLQLAEFVTKPERLLYLHVLPAYLGQPELMSSGLVRDLCRYRLLRLAVRASLHQAKNNADPESLDLLDSGDLQIDPYTGQSFLMRIDDDSIMIYSVSENRIDDGGSSEGDLWFGEDMGVRVPKINR
ncbi:MAG: hypothetical protein KF777_16350 [Planctomycetaceae bacterium]|nr:hypothetical protein [Planctomycetaceae bacterium]